MNAQEKRKKVQQAVRYGTVSKELLEKILQEEPTRSLLSARAKAEIEEKKPEGNTEENISKTKQLGEDLVDSLHKAFLKALGDSYKNLEVASPSLN